MNRCLDERQYLYDLEFPFLETRLTYGCNTTYNSIMKNSASAPKELQDAIADALRKIGEQIIAVRRARRLTQTDLAGMLGVDQNSISKYEKGDVDLSIGRLMHLGSILGVDWIELVRPPKFKMIEYPGQPNSVTSVKNLPRPDEDHDAFIRRMVEGLISEKVQESESRILERLTADKLEEYEAKRGVTNGDPAVGRSNSSSTT
jgi:transcriptional regulator with XRE-family HTH domain